LRQSGSAVLGLQQLGEGIATGDLGSLGTAVLPYVGTTPRVHARFWNTAGMAAGLPRHLSNLAPQPVQDVLARARNISETPVSGVPGAWPLASSAGRSPLQPSTWMQPRGPSTVGQIPYRASAATARAARPWMPPLLADRSSGDPLQSSEPRGRTPSLRDLSPEDQKAWLDQFYDIRTINP
jgi:hypothetical protein